VALDIADVYALELDEQWGRGLGMVGSYHVQPDGNLRASETDFIAAERQHEYLELRGAREPFVASLILTPENGNLTDLSAQVWVTTRDVDGRLVTEPARLVLGDG